MGHKEPWIRKHWGMSGGWMNIGNGLFWLGYTHESCLDKAHAPVCPFYDHKAGEFDAHHYMYHTIRGEVNALEVDIRFYGFRFCFGYAKVRDYVKKRVSNLWKSLKKK